MTICEMGNEEEDASLIPELEEGYAQLESEMETARLDTLLTGEYGEEGFFISLPCVVGADGVEEVMRLDLSDAEIDEFRKSCAHVKENLARTHIL